MFELPGPIPALSSLGAAVEATITGTKHFLDTSHTRLLDTRHWILDTGYWTLDTRHGTLDSWILDNGY
jgi:hypothetical protein